MALINVPVIGQSLNGSRGQIQQNFADIDATLAINHAGYNLANAGKHTTVQFTQQAYVLPALGPVTLATEATIFTRNSIEAPGILGLFLKGPNQAANVKPIEFSFKSIVSPGYTILPSGLILMWGTALTVNATNTDWFFNAGGPNILGLPDFPNAGLFGIVSPNTIAGGVDGDNIIGLSGIAANGFTINRIAAHHGTQLTFNFLVLGY
jgi:hypothetical protein